jgi:diguanylate cyclase (GGDEF)-like protein
MALFKKFMVANKSFRYKLLLAFILMSIIPLLAITYVISVYLFPQLQDMLSVSITVTIAVIISILGLFLAKGLIDPVINMAIEARIIASGNYDRSLPVSSDDEVGNLAISINSMTQRIKTNIDDLKNYGQKMRDINMEIHKKVLALSSLLQIGEVISAGSVQLDSFLELAVEKASMVFDVGFGVLYMPNDKKDFIARISYNLDKERLSGLVLKEKGAGVLDNLFETHDTYILDKSIKPTKDLEKFKEANGVNSILAIPIYSGKRNMAMLVLGNRVSDFKYRPDDVDLVKVFSKQIAIAIESDFLNRKASELAIKDDLTDLFNKSFIVTRLEEEIKRSVFYQRPCSYVAFNIDNFNGFRQMYGEIQAEEALRKVAKIIKDNTTPVGKAARVGGDEFVMLLPEKNKREATNIAEEIKRKLESANMLREGRATVTVTIGVSENPIDGATADEISKKAIENIRESRASQKK